MTASRVQQQRWQEAKTVVGGLWEGFGLVNPASRWIAQLGNSIYPNELPSPDQLVHAYRCGMLNEDQLVRGCNSQGVYPPRVNQEPAAGFAGPLAGWKRWWEGVWGTTVTTPEPGELLFLMNTNLINRETYSLGCSLNGLYDNQWRVAFEKGYANKVPDPEAIISYAVKDVWDDNAVRRFEYDSEFPATFGYWMQMIGAAGDSRRRDDAGNPIGEEVGWDKIAWREHWRNLSPSQAYEMFQRLRPGRINRWRGAVDIPATPNNPAVPLRSFPLSDLALALAINDYPRPFRPQLAAIAYRTPRLVDIDRFYQTDQIDAKEVEELHLDLGYSPADAEMRTKWLSATKLTRLLPKPRTNPVTALVNMYVIGLMDRHTCKDDIYYFLTGVSGLENPAGHAGLLDEAFQTRAMQQAELQLRSADYRIAAKSASEVIAVTRRRYLRGYIGFDIVQTTLAEAGVLHSRIVEYLISWDRQLQGGKLLASTAQIKRLAIEGIITTTVARDYLHNLKWEEPEIGWLLGEIKYGIERQKEAVAAKTAKTKAQKQRHTEAIHRLAVQEHARTYRKMTRGASDAQLSKYAIRGVITLDDYVNELKRREYDARTITNRAYDVIGSRTAWLASKQGAAYGVGARPWNTAEAARRYGITTTAQATQAAQPQDNAGANTPSSQLEGAAGGAASTATPPSRNIP